MTNLAKKMQMQMFSLKTNMIIFVVGDEGEPDQKPEGGDEPPGRAR